MRLLLIKINNSKDEFILLKKITNLLLVRNKK